MLFPGLLPYGYFGARQRLFRLLEKSHYEEGNFEVFIACLWLCRNQGRATGADLGLCMLDGTSRDIIRDEGVCVYASRFTRIES